MLLNSDFKTAKGADSRQRAESLSRAVRKHGLLGMKKMEGMMKERLASRLLSFVLEGQGRWWTREILQKYMSTPARIRTHANALSTVWVCRDSWRQTVEHSLCDVSKTYANSSNQILNLCSHRWFSVNCLVPSFRPNYDKWLNVCVGC